MRIALGLLGLLVCGLALGVLLSACGSGTSNEVADDQGQSVSTETPRSERVEREASIMQQQAAVTEQVPEQVGDEEEQAEDWGQEAVAAGEIDFGHRKGLPFNRNVVGDPDAPVLIVEYSDFQ